MDRAVQLLESFELKVGARETPKKQFIKNEQHQSIAKTY